MGRLNWRASSSAGTSNVKRPHMRGPPEKEPHGARRQWLPVSTFLFNFHHSYFTRKGKCEHMFIAISLLARAAPLQVGDHRVAVNRDRPAVATEGRHQSVSLQQEQRLLDRLGLQARRLHELRRSHAPVGAQRKQNRKRRSLQPLEPRGTIVEHRHCVSVSSCSPSPPRDRTYVPL